MIAVELATVINQTMVDICCTVAAALTHRQYFEAKHWLYESYNNNQPFFFTYHKIAHSLRQEEQECLIIYFNACLQ